MAASRYSSRATGSNKKPEKTLGDKFEQVQTASFADTEATYQAALGNNYYWNRLGGYYVDAAIAKVDRRSWLAGSYLKVIGYR